MASFFYTLHQALLIHQSLEAMDGPTKWLALKKKAITTRSEKYIKDAVYWRRSYALLCEIWYVLKILQISD